MPTLGYMVYESTRRNIAKYYKAIKDSNLKIKNTDSSEYTLYNPKIHSYEKMGNYFDLRIDFEPVFAEFLTDNDPETYAYCQSIYSPLTVKTQSNMKISPVAIDFGFEGEYKLDVGHRKTGTRAGNDHSEEYTYGEHNEAYIYVLLDSSSASYPNDCHSDVDMASSSKVLSSDAELNYRLSGETINDNS